MQTFLVPAVFVLRRGIEAYKFVFLAIRICVEEIALKQ